MDSQITYFQYYPYQNTELLEKLVGCYRRVFSEEPWSEWKRCPVCGQKWGREDEGLLTSMHFKHCNELLDDFWSRTKVKEDIFKEVTPQSSCWLALVDSKVVGFSWGYPITPQALEEKLKFPGISAIIEQKFGQIDKVAYQDEIGVVKKFRGRKIAKEMFRRRLQDFRDKQLNVCVARTKVNPPTVNYLWYTKLGYEVIGEYNDQDQRVILACTIEALDL